MSGDEKNSNVVSAFAVRRGWPANFYGTHYQLDYTQLVAAGAGPGSI